MKFKHEQKKMEVIYWVAGIVVGCVTIAGFVYLQMVVMEREQANRELEAFAQQARKENIELLEKAGEEGVDVRDAASTIDRNVTALEEAAQGLRGTDAMAMEVLARVLRELQGHTDEFARSLQAFENLGGFDASSITERAGINARRSALDAMDVANEAYDDFLDGLESRLRGEFVTAGLGTDAARQIAADFARDSHLTIGRKIRETDRRVIASSRAMLSILDDAWGTWTYDPASEMLQFETDDQIQRFNEAFTALQQAADEQLRLQQEVLEREKRKAAQGQ